MTARTATLTLLLCAVVLLAACRGEDTTERPNDPTAAFGERGPDEAPENEFVAFAVDASPTPAYFFRRAAARWELDWDGDARVRTKTDEEALDRLCTGQVPIAGTTRRISADESAICRANGVDLLSVPVAYRAVVVAASDELGLECITLPELRRLWSAGTRVATLDSLRPNLPNRAPRLFGPPAGTQPFELFARVVTHGRGLRADYVPAEDRAVAVDRVIRARRAIAFHDFGLVEPRYEGEVDIVAVDAGRGCVLPTTASVQRGRYAALARPLYMHVARHAMQRNRRLRSYVNLIFRRHRRFASESPAVIPSTSVRGPAGELPGPEIGSTTDRRRERPSA